MNTKNITDSDLLSIRKKVFGAKKSLSNIQRKLLGSDVPMYLFDKDFSVSELRKQIEIFPEAILYLKSELKRYKQILKKEEEAKYIIYRKSVPENREFWTAIVEALNPKERFKVFQKVLTPVPQIYKDQYNLSVEKAKQYPISDLLPIRQNRTKCIFHDDHNPSLTYYPKTNSVYCFSCNNSADSIKVYQTLYNCSFRTALKALQ